MLYVPPIFDYKPFYVQFRVGNAIDILDTYKVVVKAHDYPSVLKVKEPYKNQWKDQHGDEEYIDPLGLKYEAFTFKLECAMFARGNDAISELKTGLRAFQNALAQGFFRTYDAYTGFGFKDVRLSEFPAPADDAYDLYGQYTRLIFSVTLKVNDPATSMKYNQSLNYIVEG